MNKAILLFLSVFTVISCSRDKLDFDMTDDLRFTPEVEVPLINAKLSLGDLALKDSTFKVSPDNRVTIEYFKDSIFSFNAIDFVKIPDQDAFEFPISPLFNPFDLEMSIGTLGGVQLAETYFDNGFLKFGLSTTDTILTEVKVKVTIKNGDISGMPMSKTITLPAGVMSVEDSLDVTTGKIDFSSGGVNFLGLKAEILNAGAVTPPTSLIKLSCRFTKLELLSASGNFGNRHMNIPNSSFDFDISGISQFVNGLYLTNPQIKLISKSSIGVDLGLEADFDGINKAGDLTSLGAQPQTITAPSSIGAFKYDTIKFDRNNSNIADFIASLPTSILYGGRVELNPGTGTPNNFIHKNSKVVMGVNVKLPLEVQAQNLLLEQTLDGIEFLKENPEEVESLNLIFNTKNGFPFDVHVSIAFMDTVTNDSIDGISLQILTAPPIGPQGKVLSRSQHKEVVSIDKVMMENLKRSDKMRLRARVSTPNSGQQIVKFYTDYDLEVKIATQVKLNVKL